MQEIESLIDHTDRLFSQLLVKPGEHAVGEIESTVQALFKHARQSPDAMIGIVHLRTDIKYSVLRAIQNTLFSLLISDKLEWFDEPRTFSLCCAALTEQISLYPLRETLNEQSEGLSPWQYEMIQTYPQRAVKTLLSIGVSDQRWLHTVGALGDDTHTAEELSTEIAVLRVVNHYGAMISQRGTRKPVSKEKAIRSLSSEYTFKEEQVIAETLLYQIGFYPPGSTVQLRNGEIAVVTHTQSREQSLRLSSICDENGVPFQRPQPRNTNDPPYQVEHSIYLDWAQHINTELLWGDSDAEQPMLITNR